MPEPNVTETTGAQQLPVPPTAAPAGAETGGAGVAPVAGGTPFADAGKTLTGAPPPTAAPPVAGAAAESPTAHHASPSDAHKTWLGHIAEALHNTVHGIDQVEVLNPETGEKETKYRQRTPGSFFRSLVAGALIGGAVGAEKPEQGFMGGFARGGAAAIGDQRKMDEVRRAHEGEDFEHRQKVIKQTADIAHAHIQDVVAVGQMDLMHKDHIDRLNQVSEQTKNAVMAAGGNIPTLQFGGKDVNGQQGNGAALRDAHVDTKLLDKSPEGFHRVHTMKVDTSGLERQVVNGQLQWVDKEGKYVDLADRTTHTFIDVPINAWTEPQPFKGEDLNKMHNTDVYKEGQTYRLPLETVMAGKWKSTEVANNSTRAEAAELRAQHFADMYKTQVERLQFAAEKRDIEGGNALLRNLETAKTDLRKQLEDPLLDPKRKAELLEQSNQLNQQEAEAREQLRKALPGYKKAAPAAAAKPAGAAPPAGSEVEAAVAVGANMSPEAFAKVVAGSIHLTPEQKQQAIEAHKNAAGAKKPASTEAPTAATVKEYRALQEAKSNLPTKRREDSRLDPDTKKMVKGTYYLVPGKGEQFVSKSEEAQFLKEYQDKVKAAQAAWDEGKK